jgi:hypothetical protein
LNNTKINPRSRRYIIFGACIVLPLLVLLLAIRLVIIRAVLSDSPADFYSNSIYQKDVLLENFPIYQQAYANSCGPTTISMAYSYLVEPISEQELADKIGFALGQSGMLPTRFYQALNSALGEYGFQVEHQDNITNTKFLERAYLQLNQGVPVPIYFSTINDWNKPNYDTHYSLIIGMRPQKNEVVIANAYGFLVEMPISELLRDIKYDNFLNAPFDFRVGLFVGLINRNNLFLIVK